MKAVIIEDESINAQELMKKIGKVAPDIEVQQILPGVKTAKRWLMDNKEPDLFFMDIQLSDGISFELFDEYHVTCPIIFTTAYDEYALRAFRVNGIDYLLKPVNTQELKNAIKKARRFVQEPAHTLPANWQELHTLLSTPAQKPLYKEKFIIHNRQQWIPVATRDIALFLRDNLNFLLTFHEEKYYPDHESLEELEELLDPAVFFRANRQCIINIQAIHSVRPQDNGKLLLSLKAPFKQTVEVSREKAPAFRKWFELN